MNAFRRRDERNDGHADPAYEAQVLAGEVSVEQLHRRVEDDGARLAEALESSRSHLGQRKRLRDHKLALVRREGVLVELIDVGKQPP